MRKPAFAALLCAGLAAIGACGAEPASDREGKEAMVASSRNGEPHAGATGGRGLRSGRAVELGVVMREEVGARLEGQVVSSAAWVELAEIGLSSPWPDAQPIEVCFRRPASDQVLAAYVLVPWQPLGPAPGAAAPGPIPALPNLAAPLLVVMEPALVFGPTGSQNTGDEGAKLRSDVAAVLADVFDLEVNQTPLGPELAAPLPEGLQVMSLTSFPHYLSIEIALPGSRLPPDAEIQGLAPHKMIQIFLTPDRGPVIPRWLAPEEPMDARRGPESAVPDDAPGEDAGDPEALLDVPGSSEPPWEADDAELFDDYTPKTSPDDELDYRDVAPLLCDLPSAEIAELGALVAALGARRQLAQKNPGVWEEGNVLLGAADKVYRPSDAELVESILGRRIQRAVATADPDEVDRALRAAGLSASHVLYRRIDIMHVDAMGSGRFFYASEPIETRIALRVE